MRGLAALPAADARDQHVEHRKNKQHQQGRRDQAADHDYCQRPLGLGAYAGRQRHRQQAERSEQRCHQHGAQPGHRPLRDCLLGRQAVILQFIEERHHDDAVQDGLAEQRDESDRGRYGEIDAGQPERENSADHREGNIGHDDERRTEGLESVEQQQEYDEYRYRHDECKPLHGAFLVFEFTRPGDVVAFRELDVRVEQRLEVGDDAPHVPAADEDADRKQLLAVFARDVHGAADRAERGDLRQRHVRPVWRRDQQRLQPRVVPFRLVQPDRDPEALLPFPHLGYLLAAQRGFDDVLNVLYVDAVAGGARAVDADLDLGLFAEPVDICIRNAVDFLEFVQRLGREIAQDIHVIAEYLDDDLALDLRDAFQDIVPHRHRKARVDPRHLADFGVHLVQQLDPGDAALPFGFRLQVDEELEHVDRLGIGAILRPAGLG